MTLRIYASTTSRTVAGISTIFAENLGTNNTLVFDGTVNLTTGNLPGPGNTRQFDYVFPFTPPFLYDPADGNLVLDLQIESSGSALTFDTVSGDPAIGRVGIGSSSATTGDIRASHVTQLTFEPPPKVTVRLGQSVYWTTEGNDTVWLTVERGNDVAQEPFTVQYATSDLTANAGLDYETAAGVLNFAPGETNKTVAIKIFNDELQENEETFRVTLSKDRTRPCKASSGLETNERSFTVPPGGMTVEVSHKPSRVASPSSRWKAQRNRAPSAVGMTASASPW